MIESRSSRREGEDGDLIQIVDQLEEPGSADNEMPPSAEGEANPYRPQELRPVFESNLDNIQRRMYKELAVISAMHVQKFKKFSADKDQQQGEELKKLSFIKDREIASIRKQNAQYQKKLEQLEIEALIKDEELRRLKERTRDREAKPLQREDHIAEAVAKLLSQKSRSRRSGAHTKHERNNALGQ